MSDFPGLKDARYLFFIPAFYGAVSWGAWLALYSMNLIRIDRCSTEALALYLFVELMFLLATLVSLPAYRRAREEPRAGESPAGRGGTRSRGATSWLLLILHGAGFLGLIKYVADFSANLGGIYGFLFALASEAESIRREAESSSSTGTQLSYAGWVAIGLTVYFISSKKVSRWWWFPVLLQFAGNLMFIDRTRPFTILFTSLLMVLPATGRPNLRKIMAWGGGAFLFALVCFWMIAQWSNKSFYQELDQGSPLPGITQDIYLYGVSGFAYFNYMLENREEISYAPERLLYPANKLLARAGVAAEPPSPILEFYQVPFSTNVGTFLEPLYRDGGMLFAVLGTLLYSFGLNRLALCFLRCGTPLACYAWATICFTTFICFFVPKISFLGTWLFVGLGAASLALTWIERLDGGRPEQKAGSLP
jgi:oligosaccharide repeat unit polymerase